MLPKLEIAKLQTAFKMEIQFQNCALKFNIDLGEAMCTDVSAGDTIIDDQQ